MREEKEVKEGEELGGNLADEVEILFCCEILLNVEEFFKVSAKDLWEEEGKKEEGW